jgi:undecaprenyl-diphosphatase
LSLIEAILIAIVEGITEFLPVSSTGHMIIAQHILGVEPTVFTKAFTVIIQFGAITSVLFLYWKRFFQSVDFYFKLLIAFIPAAVVGLLFGNYIDALLEEVSVVAASLVLGGWVLIFSDKWFAKNFESEEKAITPLSAFMVGCFQCIAMIPGVSRSAATILGGMSRGWNRKQAAEFSFFLAVPTMFAASLKKTYDITKNGYGVLTERWDTLLIGCVVAAVVALIAIQFMMRLIQTRGFAVFGWYRVVLGGLILALLMSGVNLQMAD